MKLNLKFISTLVVILLGIVLASQAGTFKPFIRSRYSIRWRKTTDAPKVWDSSTASGVKEGIENIPIRPIELSDILTNKTLQLTTINTLLKTSTHSTDYDYYNNEVDEGEHKN